MFAIYRILLSWRTYEYYYETDELPNPTNSPTQGLPNPRKIRSKARFGPLYPHQIIFRGLGLVLYRKRTTRNLTQPDSLQTPYYATVFIVQYCRSFPTVCIVRFVSYLPHITVLNSTVRIYLTGISYRPYPTIRILPFVPPTYRLILTVRVPYGSLVSPTVRSYPPTPACNGPGCPKRERASSDRRPP